jgi:hypothetical protein
MCIGGSSSSSSTSQASNQTTVNVSTSTPVNIDTADLSDALAALAGAQVLGAQEQAQATVQAAQITSAGANSLNSGTIILIIIALAGFLVTARVIKLKVG